jgi:hypothetical protein
MCYWQYLPYRYLLLAVCAIQESVNGSICNTVIYYW